MGRIATANSPLNRTLYDQLDIVLAGSSLDLYVENASTIDGAFANTAVIVPPSGLPFSTFRAAGGNLINISVDLLTAGALADLYIDEAGCNNGRWLRTDAICVQADFPMLERAYRFVLPLLKITIANVGGVFMSIRTVLRVSTG